MSRVNYSPSTLKIRFSISHHHSKNSRRKEFINDQEDSFIVRDEIVFKDDYPLVKSSLSPMNYEMLLRY